MQPLLVIGSTPEALDTHLKYSISALLELSPAPSAEAPPDLFCEVCVEEGGEAGDEDVCVWFGCETIWTPLEQVDEVRYLQPLLP